MRNKIKVCELLNHHSSLFLSLIKTVTSEKVIFFYLWLWVARWVGVSLFCLNMLALAPNILSNSEG